jgi:hypothetical protein
MEGWRFMRELKLETVKSIKDDRAAYAHAARELCLDQSVSRNLGYFEDQPENGSGKKGDDLNQLTYRLMMHAESFPEREERWILPVGEQHLRPLHPARPLGARARNPRQSINILTAHRQFDRMPPSCHHTNPRSANANEESTNRLPVPPRLVSWNRVV